METKRYRLAKPTKYTKDGEEKTKWETVGTLTIIEEPKKKKIVEIPAIGLTAFAFSIDEKKQEVSEEINPEDIPF
jgi:hypothetical protein